MGRSAKIMRGGDKRRVNEHRQAKKIEEAKKKEAESLKKPKRRVKIDASVSKGGEVKSTALATSEQKMVNSVKKMELQKSRVATATLPTPTPEKFFSNGSPPPSFNSIPIEVESKEKIQHLTQGSSGVHETPEGKLFETSRIKWAWSLDRTQAPQSPDGSLKGPSLHEIGNSSVRGDLLDVVRLLSTSTVQTQTLEPSYTASLSNVHLEGEKARSIAVQAGRRALHLADETVQVTEGDLTSEQGQQNAFGGDDRHEEPILTIGPVSSMHSGYLPTCNVPPSLYPVFMGDARALGIANRYGYVALPKPPVELPPRRRVKTISPQDYPHLYGSHNPKLDDHTGRQLHRAHSLWTAQSGFVPKY